MTGGMIDGYCAMGRPVIATRPRMTVRIAITIATMGRSTKKRVTGSLARRGWQGLAWP